MQELYNQYIILSFHYFCLIGKYPNRGYPKIFDDADVGAEARKLFNDAQAMLAQIVDGKWLTPKGVVGIFPASSVGDDIKVFAPADDDKRDIATPLQTFCTLRQQAEKENDDPYLALSDFIAPLETRVKDYIGAFAVAIQGGEEQLAAFKAENDGM